MFHTVYETLNCVNGKHYVGVHSTNDPYDDYLGTGHRITRAIKKHGRENFEKFILGIFPTEEDAYAAESLIVNQEFVDDRMTYNATIGGHGCSRQVADRISKTLKGFKHSDEAKSNMSAAQIRIGNKPPSPKGKLWSDDRKAKLSASQ